MRALTLKPVASGEQNQAACGRSLSSNYAPPKLENKILLQSSLLTSLASFPPASLTAHPSSCPSLQPSTLSSTTSTFLFTAASSSSSSPSAPSPLLSTQNRLLSSKSTTLSFSSLSSTVPASGSLLSTSVVAAVGTPPDPAAHPPASPLFPNVGEDAKKDDGEGMVERVRSSSEESVADSESDTDFSEEDEDAISFVESPDLEMDYRNQEYDQTVSRREEEFAEAERGKEAEEALKDKKYLLLNAVCCSLINKGTAPGQKDWDSEDSVWTGIMKLAKDIAACDPQFLLKVAVYTRQELNMRITANFLLALAANLPSTKPHVRRYFCAAVQLPSDWLEVVRIYSTCFSRSLPMCLKKAMADKFKQFSEYQLAKYNTRKHRCKHNRNRRNKTKPTEEQLDQWANMLRSNATILKKFLQVESSPTVVDKKQSEFSLKKLIKRLHIKEPAEHVMAILGRKYPADAKSFIHSGLQGVWDRQRAGQRMKLKKPETWERLLSEEGNKAATWEKLIDNGSLPFMAMLRNLRNMITQGISEEHHHKILRRLTNKKAVIQSRQFPFRFLAAYKVIMELNKMAKKSLKELPPVKEILKEVLKNIPKSQRFKRLDWDTAKTRRMRVALGVPFVYRIYNMKKAQFLKANQRKFTVELLDRYRKALETAIQVSCRYNVPPLPGRTVILISIRMMFDLEWSKKQDFCLPRDSEDENEESENEQDDGRRKKTKKDKLIPSVTEMAVLLALMIRSSAEDSILYLLDWSRQEKVNLESDVLLENVKTVMKQIKALENGTNWESNDPVRYKMFTKENKVDNIIVLADSWINGDVQWAINGYRKHINSNVFIMKIFASRHGSDKQDKNCVVVNGFSEQLLRFVAERGSSRLLDHVEHLDKVYNVPPPEGGKDPETASDTLPLVPGPKLSWRGVRVFISSTFRDMHTERDVLVRSVFPELRRRAMQHCLYLQEVDLRWGVTEEDSDRATELCLSEVCRSQMLIGLLGERYGLVPSKLDLPDLPQYSWLASAPAGLSVTELEIRQFQALFPDATQERMFFYFRDPNVVKSIPVTWKSHFSPESQEAESKLADLKSRILDSNAKVTQNYPCEWAGVVDGTPQLKNLEGFAKAVLEDIWTALLTQFVQEGDESGAAAEVREQDLHQGAMQRQFFGRAKLLSSAVELANRIQTKGGLMVVDAAAGEGKTVFMAALAEALRTGDKSKRNQTGDVIAYSAAASQSARSVENLLRCAVQCLRKMTDTEEKSSFPRSYREQLSEFHSGLSDVKKSRPLALLVDGADLVRDGGGQLTSDWIPQHLPQGVCLIISVTSSSALLQTLVKKRGAILLSLGQLTVSDRKEMVQKGLETFGKKLSDSAFNNQLQTLIMKKGAVSPLYLHLACEDLRNFATFDKLKDSLQRLPETLSQLVCYDLQTLCLQYRGYCGLRAALVALTVSTDGLRERDFYTVLDICNNLPEFAFGSLHWQYVMNQFRKPRGSIPMATFTSILQTLKSLIGRSHCCDTDDLLALTNPELRRAFEDTLISDKSVRTRGHFILAAHQWAAADPQGNDTFSHCEASTLKNLPSNLMASEQLEELQFLLSNYYFLHANVRHGLLHNLMKTYTLYDEKHGAAASAGSQASLTDCWSFLRRHASLLSSWPALFIQQAFNEPHQTPAHSWAQSVAGKGGVRLIEWRNNEEEIPLKNCELVSTFSSEPTSLVLSLNGELMVVGTGQGTLHFIHTKTGQEVKSLVSSCDGISSCVFLSDSRLATTSYDGRIEMWDTENCCRTGLIDGHTNVITASDVSLDKKHLATVSLDCMLKVWSSARAHEAASMHSPSPLNCVTFDPEGRLLAAGCWNGKVIVWNWLQDKIQTSLSGHQSSVRSVSFSSSSSMLCSGSLSGEVRLWSVSSSTCVGCFQAHCGATEALAFLDDGAMLLSAGSDHVLQLWSRGLGRSVITLKTDDREPEPPQKKAKPVPSEPAALCAAVKDDFATVGYHGEGIKIFSTDSGEKIWASEDLQVSVLCLLWLSVEAEQEVPERLVSGGGDKRLRIWQKKGGDEGILGGLVQLGEFGVQQGAIVALAQNSTYLASASDDFTIALWRLTEMTLDPWAHPTAVPLLRGHNRGVTCLDFSPDGQSLLSGGKDQSLIVWNVSSSPAVITKTILQAHRDWITGCVWTPDCVLSSSNDGRIRVWDVEAGQSLREISWKSPLTSICCVGQYVIAGCVEGALHVWSWESNIEICHIPAHKQRVHHCSVLQSAGTAEVTPENMTVSTASDDGTVQLWKPLQVEHFSTFQGHSGGIHGVVPKEGFPEFITVSEDCSLRRWLWKIPSPPSLRGAVSALCFSQSDDLVLVGYESGFLELWQHNSVVGQKQVSAFSVTAICCMPDGQFAVSCRKPSVDVWKLVWNQHNSANLAKVHTYSVSEVVVRLTYCAALIAVSENSMIFNVAFTEENKWNQMINSWNENIRVLWLRHNDEKSMWLAGECDGNVHLAFIISMGPKISLCSAFGTVNLDSDEPEEKRSLITAVSVDGDLVVCGDVKGNMWFIQPPDMSWSNKKPAHSGRISVLRLSSSTIVSASYDGTVKLWDRNSKKQVGMFVCGNPVLVLEVHPQKPNELVCGDEQGKLYFLSWKE